MHQSLYIPILCKQLWWRAFYFVNEQKCGNHCLYINNMQREVFEELVLLKFTVEIPSSKQFFLIFSYKTAQVWWVWIGSHFVGSLSNVHCFPSNINSVTYNRSLLYVIYIRLKYSVHPHVPLVLTVSFLAHSVTHNNYQKHRNIIQPSL